MATFPYNFTIKLETFSHRKASQNTECETWDHRTYYAVSLSGLLKIAFLQGNPCFHPHFPSCHSVLSSCGAFVFMGRPPPWDRKPSSLTGTSSVFALTPGAQFPFFLSFFLLRYLRQQQSHTNVFQAEMPTWFQMCKTSDFRSPSIQLKNSLRVSNASIYSLI